MNDNIQYWLAVHHTPELGRQLPELLEHYGDVRSLCESCRVKGRAPALLIKEPNEYLSLIHI